MRSGKYTRKRSRAGLAALALSLFLPFLMGGCPEFRNESVDAIETASRGLLNAGLNLFFDQFRADESP